MFIAPPKLISLEEAIGYVSGKPAGSCLPPAALSACTVLSGGCTGSCFRPNHFALQQGATARCLKTPMSARLIGSLLHPACSSRSFSSCSSWPSRLFPRFGPDIPTFFWSPSFHFDLLQSLPFQPLLLFLPFCHCPANCWALSGALPPSQPSCPSCPPPAFFFPAPGQR